VTFKKNSPFKGKNFPPATFVPYMLKQRKG
jgi:hypothetical protein